MVNQAILVGRIGSDAEIAYTPSKMAVSKFSLATSKKFKGETQTTWHRVTLFGKLAESVNQYLKKGQLVYVEGEISNREYVNKTGQKVNTSEILGNQVRLLGGHKDHAEEIATPQNLAEQIASGQTMDAPDITF